MVARPTGLVVVPTVGAPRPLVALEGAGRALERTGGGGEKDESGDWTPGMRRAGMVASARIGVSLQGTEACAVTYGGRQCGEHRVSTGCDTGDAPTLERRWYRSDHTSHFVPLR